jgi:hypothetical protein
MATTRVQVSTLPAGATASTFLRGDGTWAAAGAADDVFWENAQTISSDYSITASKNALTVGDIKVNTGITVTVPTGTVWYIL